MDGVYMCSLDSIPVTETYIFFIYYNIRGSDMFWFKSQYLWKLFWKTSSAYSLKEFQNMFSGFM